VVGPGDRGIAGAEVALFKGEDAGAAPEGSLADLLSGRARVPVPSASLFTKVDGTFRFETAAASPVSLRAEKEGWAPATLLRFAVRGDAEGLVLRLSAPVPVTGLVLRMSEGAWVPLAGASVILFGAAVEEGGKPAVLAMAQTGEDGRYALAGTAPGIANLVVLAKGMKPYFQPRMEVPEEGREVRLEPAVLKSLRGEVLLPDGISPAHGIRVTVTTRPRGRPAEAVQEASTDRNGRFVFPEVEGGENCGLSVTCDGGALGYATLARFPWPGDSDERITLEAPPAETLRGRAVADGPDGVRRPAAGVRLGASCVWESRSGKIQRQDFTTTAADGSFEFHGLTDREVGVFVAPDSGSLAVVDPLRGLVPWKPASGPWEVEVVLANDPRASKFGEVAVAGRVVGPDGQSVPGARVEGFGFPACTDREGRFLLRGLVPNTSRQVGMKVSIRAAADGFQPSRGEEIFLLPGADPTGMLLTLPGVLLPLRGRVEDEEGRPLPGAKVTLPRIGVAWTGPDGWWRAEAIPGTVSTATVSLGGYKPVSLGEVQVGDPVETVVLVRE
jgi:hypothetical protein